MDFKNWTLLLIIVGVIGFAAYYMYNNPHDLIIVREQSDSPSQKNEVAGDEFQRPSDWQEYRGETLKFYYPPHWEPENHEPFGGTVVEEVVLNIPNTIDNHVFYSPTPFDAVRPDDIVREETIEINSKRWVKWVRTGEGYVTYDYFTSDAPLPEGVVTFGIHVTVLEEDEELENELKDFISTIEFEGEVEEEIDDGEEEEEEEVLEIDSENEEATSSAD